MNLMGHRSPGSSRIRPILSGQGGIALLMVLVVITLLATLVASFTETTQKHLQVTQSYKDRLQAYWAAQSGLQAAVALLRLDAQVNREHDGADSPWNCESEVYREFVTPLLANVFCESSMIEPALLLTETHPVEAETTLSRCPPAAPILDENRKLSLFRLVTNVGSMQEQTDPWTFDRLAYLLQYLLTEEDLVPPEGEQASGLSLDFGRQTRLRIDKARELAGCLVDWVDTPNNRSRGPQNPDTAEEGCPLDDLPYQAKNGMLDSIDEIALVCGFRQMPRTTIERLTRHLTVYDLVTNINTATYPVLHAFCAAFLQDENETEAEKVYRALHPVADVVSMDVIRRPTDYRDILGGVGLNPGLIGHLQGSTVYVSSFFRVGIYGLVFDTETGAVRARSRLQMDLRRERGQQLGLLYYRED